MCIKRKTCPVPRAELVNIVATQSIELVCIDFLSLERSKGGHENILVISDHFTRHAQALPTQLQKCFLKISFCTMDSLLVYIATREEISRAM